MGPFCQSRDSLSIASLLLIAAFAHVHRTPLGRGRGFDGFPPNLSKEPLLKSEWVSSRLCS